LLPITTAPNCRVLPFTTKALSGITVTLLTVDFSSSSGCQKSRQADNNVVIMTDSKNTFTFLLFIIKLLPFQKEPGTGLQPEPGTF
jgi:hypothetical protein